MQSAFCKNDQTATPLQAALFGCISRCLSGALLLPATLVKTRLESGLFPYAGVRDALKIIYKNEGLGGLFSGLGVTLLRDAPFSALHLAIYTYLRTTLSECRKKDQLIQSVSSAKELAAEAFACSLLAALSASFITQPADVIKTRLQTRTGNGNCAMNTALEIGRQEGVHAFWVGLTPRIMRRTLMSALTWTLYESLISAAGLK